jgi:hypothetical protein
MNNLIREKAHSLFIKYLQDNAALNVEDAGKVADFFHF